jgi:hypothetical protein
MDWSIPLAVAFASFMGGLLVVSSVISWVGGLLLFFKPSGTVNDGRRSGLAIVPLLFHSGPWVLLIAVAGIYYAATSGRPEYVWAVVGGFASAIALVGAAILLGFLRRRRQNAASKALTPERLLAVRRRFFWINSVLFGVGLPALVGLQSPQVFGGDNGFVVLMLFVSFGCGWLWSWFMWQWYGAALQAKEKARQRRERANAV